MAQKVRIIGVPMDLGQSRRGVDMGPSALRGAGLQPSIKKLGLQVEDIGNLSVKQPEEMPIGEKRAKYLQEIAETCGDVAAAAEKALTEGFLPLVLGGDHSIAAGVAAGVANYFRKDKKQIGYLWLDAHGDMKTPASSPSCNERGMREVMSDALKYAMDDTAGVAVSLDKDFVDPADAPGVGTPVRGGVTYREAHLAMEMIADTESMVSLEVVEINPILDEHNRTALLGVELVLSGLGQKIL